MQTQMKIIETILGHYSRSGTFGGIFICKYIRSVLLHLYVIGIERQRT